MAAPFQVTEADLDTATRTLFGEARGEPLKGQQAVAWVLRTRAAWHPQVWWGAGLGGVCKKPKQFSCWNPDDPNRARLLGLAEADPEYQTLRAVVKSVMKGEVDDPTDGATHYEVVGTGAGWAAGRAPSCVIGRHAFYRIGP